MARLSIRNRNDGQFYKDGRKKKANWEYRFETAPINGKRQSVSKSGFATKKEAEKSGTEALEKYNNGGVKVSGGDMSFSDYLDLWFNSYVVPCCRYRTQQAYSIVISSHLKPSLGKYKLTSLTPNVLQEFVNSIYQGGLKKTTLTNIVAVLTGSLKYAVMPGQLIQSSPALYLNAPKLTQDRVQVDTRYVISNEDIRRIFDRFGYGNPFRYAIAIGYYTGLRIGEVYALTWDDIDFDNQTINVNKLIYKRYSAGSLGTGWYFGDPKTYASNRIVKFGDVLCAELRDYRRFQNEQRIFYGEHYTEIYSKSFRDEKGNTIFKAMEASRTLCAKGNITDLVLRKENGEYSSLESFKYASRVIRQLNIKFNFHSLRHTHATKMIESGVSPKAVQARLGHEKIETTLQTYTHDTDVLHDDAVDKFEIAAAKQV